MKRLIAALLLPLALYGQATMTSTTTSVAVARNDTVIYLASLTGINAASPAASASLLLMDQEVMRVITLGSGGAATVARGQYGTLQNAHISGVTVWAGAPNLYAYTDPSGACTSTSLRVLPRVVIPSGNIWDCTAGVWVQRGGGGGSGNGDPAAYTTITYSATPVIPVAKNTGQTFLLTLTGDAAPTVDTTGITASGRPMVTLRICQDSGGSHAFTWPASFLNHGTIDGTGSACTSQTFVWDGTNFQALGLPIVTGTSDAISIPGSTSGAVKVVVPAAAGSGNATMIAGSNTVVPTDCSGTGLVQKINPDGTVTCAAGGSVIASGQLALPTGALSGNTCSASATTATATGAATTDAAEVSYASDPTGVTGYGGGTSGGISVRHWFTTNTFNVKLCNETSGSITPGALSINWRLMR